MPPHSKEQTTETDSAPSQDQAVTAGVAAQAAPLSIALAGTFTLEPVRDRLAAWLRELRIAHETALAPIGQIFLQLLDPAALFGAFHQQGRGVNVVLLRLSDLVPEELRRAGDELIEAVRQRAGELESLVAAYTQRGSALPLLVCFCPESRELLNVQGAALADLEQQLAAALSAISGVSVVTSDELLSAWPMREYDDPVADELAHVPYTPPFYAAIGTMVARRIRALLDPPYKVVVLDCDGTLWNGVVGEDGVQGICLDKGRLDLQQFIVAQHNAGMLLALCSKNEAADIEEVFRQREMPLRRDHFVSAHINWQRKSENLQALAAELDLGLDSFIFLDDNPVECAEVRAACPEVLTVNLPQDSQEAAALLRHIWAFDRWRITSEDRRRTELYRAQAEREKLRRTAPSLTQFLAGLELKIEISALNEADLPRASQLTFRTNQFNVTTLRRSEGELRQAVSQGLECLTVRVSDRFGDYGLVGVMLFGAAGERLKVDTFLLSCRVLNRGVEQRMVSRLGEIACERGLASLELPFTPTERNQPARDFLLSLGGEVTLQPGGGFSVTLQSAEAAAMVYQPEATATSDELPQEAAGKAVTALPMAERRAVLERVIEEMSARESLFADSGLGTGAGADLQPEQTDALDPLERELCAIWREVLRRDRLGADDSWFLDLNASSIEAVYAASQIRTRTGFTAPLAALLEHDTARKLATYLRRSETEAAVAKSEPHLRSIVALRPTGRRRPLFLVRAAGNDGGRFMFLPLVRYLDRERPVYALINRPLFDGSPPYASIEEMAREYLAAMRSVQPEGPYLLAGWCLGGLIAFEMASQLQAAGEQAAMLVLLDTPIENPRVWRVRDLVLKLQRTMLRLHSRFPALSRLLPLNPMLRQGSWAVRMGMLTYIDPDNHDPSFISLAFPGRFEAAALRALAPKERWEYVYERLRSEEPPVPQYIGDNAEMYRRAVRLMAGDHRMTGQYQPRPGYEGTVHLFNIANNHRVTAAWQAVLSSPPQVREFEIKGTRRSPRPHDAMMDEENVLLFAGELQKLIDSCDVTD